MTNAANQETIRRTVPIYRLYDLNTNEWIRRATEEERRESDAAGPSGAIQVDGRSCYVY